MKIIVVYLMALTSYIVAAQENPFVGTWEVDNGTTIFKVQISENSDFGVNGIVGDYQLINKNTGAVIYNSLEELSQGVFLENSIYGGFVNGKLSAGIDDRTIDHPGYSVLRGNLIIELLNTTPYQTATWKVERRQGVILSDDDRVFNIPTDLILTKIEDNPVLDD